MVSVESHSYLGLQWLHWISECGEGIYNQILQCWNSAKYMLKIWIYLLIYRWNYTLFPSTTSLTIDTFCQQKNKNIFITYLLSLKLSFSLESFQIYFSYQFC